MSGRYLYGILPAPGPVALDLRGLDDQPVLLHTLEPFVFIYSESTRERHRTSRLNLLTHERVLEALMQQGFTCLLPLQFGLTALDWEQVTRDLIQDHQSALLDLFAQLTGKREVGVKIYWQPDQELAVLAHEDPRIQQEREALQGTPLSMEQTIAFGRLVEAALEHRRGAITRHFDLQLTPLAQGVVDNAPLSQAMIYNKAFLIPWDEEPQFEQRVQELDQIYGERLRIRYNNFTAPYNFATL
ncbi:GvpL/GvpF family gas vesicle protein [Anthocerotibacter panamensis]|uniref:GvpL/GvpF family gas vesicle protein n=1 Tax=Anthocerotibacter panamensis TaxID=2857077 RepID=UPI001C405E96|nr:GvpL/GvpF family gas vesicle protein [Anthocerotibacter panamensis]